MFTQIRKISQRRRYANEVRVLRSTISPGARVRVQRDDGFTPATVMNVRGYSHGMTEVYVQADDCSFAGWHGVDVVLPLTEAPR